MTDFEFPPDTMAGRIERQLVVVDKSPAAASTEATGKPDAIRKIYDKQRAGEAFNPRINTLEGLARVLEKSVEWLRDGKESVDGLGPAVSRSGDVPPFGGFPQAGTWAAVDEYFQQDVYDVPEFVLRQPKFAKVRQYAYQVRGDSMNLAGISDGMWVVAADALEFVDVYRETESGDLVVVERTRFQGAERELTIKEVHYFRDRMELRPKSSDPSFRSIVVPITGDVDDGIEVRVIGVVLTSYRDHINR